MEIKRTLDTSCAKYDLTNLTDKEFITLIKAYEHYLRYIQHAPPAEDDSMWNKMQTLEKDRITVV